MNILWFNLQDIIGNLQKYYSSGSFGSFAIYRVNKGVSPNMKKMGLSLL